MVVPVFPLPPCDVDQMCELVCTEISHRVAVSSKLHSDVRRLATYLDQEERFIPNTYAAVDEDMRGRMLETIYEVCIFLLLLQCFCKD